MHRRSFLASALGALGATTVQAGAAAPASPASARPAEGAGAARQASSVTRLGATWRGASKESPQQVGVFEIDWERSAVRIAAAVPCPGRGHGLLAEPDGGMVAAAFRHGTWLWRLDADGQVTRRVSTDDEPGARRFCGHVIAGADGTTLLTTELDPGSGEGWIGVRDRHTLRKLDEWRSHGNEPHQLLLDADGHLMVANGSVLRTPEGRKRDLDRMASSLVRLDGRNGSRHGHWRLSDPRLSLRHLAWSDPAGQDRPLLGIALQAEHDDPSRRAEAPVLAVWDGAVLSLPSAGGSGDGYAGDVVAAGGGFIVSCQLSGQALQWRPERPSTLSQIARMHEACALSPIGALTGAIAIAGARGIGRWHPLHPAVMLAWPEAVALGSHWAELAPRA